LLFAGLTENIMNRKPYSLEWWLMMRDIAFSGRLNTGHAIRFTEPMTKERDYLLKKRKRYSELCDFIHRRMVGKYSK
jgi:hypothetical protein